GTRGWVSRAYIGRLARAAARLFAIHHEITTGRTPPRVRRGSHLHGASVAVNVRAHPWIGATILGIIHPGGAYTVIGHRGRWARVQMLNGTMGYAFIGALHGRIAGALPAARTARGPRLTAGVRVHAPPGLHARVLGL